MKISEKITAFIACFSGVFYWIHVNGHYNIKAIIADLGGVPWFYASLVTLFSILAGFIIQKEWENWNNLIDSINGEINSLRELWLWSRHLPEEYETRFDSAIKGYLKEMSKEGLNKSERGEKSEQIEKSFNSLQKVMFEMSKNGSPMMPTTFSFFTKLIEFRAKRIQYSSMHTPKLLKHSMIFSAFLLIALSLFIGIKNIWMDYAFTQSVAIMLFLIYLVINDMDYPLVPGNWHVTPDGYKNLLDEIYSHQDSA